MLEEVMAAKPFDGRLRQRWFTDEDFDLTIWFDGGNQVHGFQLCYEKRAAPFESALTWRADTGFDLSQVHDGGQVASVTPLLRAGGRPLTRDLLMRFRQQAKKIEPELKSLVISQLRHYLRQSESQPTPVRRSRSAR